MKSPRNIVVAAGLAVLAEVAAAVLFFGGATLGAVPAWMGLILLYPAMEFGHLLGADALPAGAAIALFALLAFAQFLLILWPAVEILDRMYGQRSRKE